MDSEEAKPSIIALIMFIVYRSLVFERLYREPRKSREPGASRKKAMNVEYIISGLIALALLAYLITALLKPEKF